MYAVARSARIPSTCCEYCERPETGITAQKSVVSPAPRGTRTCAPARESLLVCMRVHDTYARQTRCEFCRSNFAELG